MDDTVYAIGTRMQRKGSKVIWTIDNDNQFANGMNGRVRINAVATEIHLYCVPKNRTLTMGEWVSIENLNKNWVEVK